MMMVIVMILFNSLSLIYFIHDENTQIYNKNIQQSNNSHKRINNLVVLYLNYICKLYVSSSSKMRSNNVSVLI
jgi:hypothetical protein